MTSDLQTSVTSDTKYWKVSRAKRNSYFWGYAMIIPTVSGLLFFYIYPFFKTIFYSFTNMGAFGQYAMVGFANYKRLLTDVNMWHAARNTLLYTVIQAPLSMGIAVLIAVLLNSKIKGLSVYRTLYFLPVVTMSAAVSMVWKWLYNYDYGLINNLLARFSIKGVAWLTDPKVALFSIIAVSIWMKVGYDMVIVLAGLQGISGSYYEAASIDGAGPVSKFFYITVPLLTPTLFFLLITSLIDAFQVFDLIFMMIGDNNIALDSTQSVVLLFYRNAFVLYEKGYASAIAVMLFIVILIITIVQMKLQKKWVNY